MTIATTINRNRSREEQNEPTDNALDFELPPDLEATEPPEARGLARDEVRLMVSNASTDRIEHTAFRRITEYLEPGDLLVVNASPTMPAALSVRRENGCPLELHLSTHLGGALWVVELRRPTEAGTRPFFETRADEKLRLPGGGDATIHAPYPQQSQHDRPSRLWLATLRLPLPLHQYLDLYGFPIRYGYVERAWQPEYYQTIFARRGWPDGAASAEMPSAGRAFTPDVIARLAERGVGVAQITLHCGVSSLEAHEPPYPEWYRVPEQTARRVNAARAARHRVVAVGTTVVRALETVTDGCGVTHGGDGWTDVVVTPQRGIRSVDALLTGFHEPRASHLSMLEAITGRRHLAAAYREALRERYLWHEFGDLHLLFR